MSPNDRRALIILGAVLGLAIVWFLFLRGGGDDAAEVSPAPSAGVSSTVPVETTAAPPPVEPGGGGPVVSGRDPFSPLPAISPSPSLVVVSPSP